MGIPREIGKGLMGIFRSQKSMSNEIKMPKGAMSLREYQTALGLHQQIKRLLKEKEATERKLHEYPDVSAAKFEWPKKIKKINLLLAQDRMLPEYGRLTNKWYNTSDATHTKLRQLTGKGPSWESDRLRLD